MSGRLTDARLRDLIAALQEIQMTRKTTTAKGRGKTTTTSTGGGTTTTDPAPTPTPTPTPTPITGTGAPPLVAPSVIWSGVKASGFGGVLPTDPTRVTAKPAVHAFTVTGQRVTANTVVSFAADALGGVDYADIMVEGLTQRVTRSLYTYTDVNGVSRTLDGYHITFDTVTAVAAHAAGTVDIYCKAVAVDLTMQPRVIGPVTLYPRGSAVAWSKRVRADGTGDYTTFNAAMQALRTAAPESAEIVMDQTGSYELGSPTAGGYTSHVGYVVVRASSGVTATFYRGASFDPLNTTDANGVTAWQWWPTCGPMEFRGSGIVLDMKNWNSLKCQTEAPHWFNGCKITSSAGTRDTKHWNKAPPPGLNVSSFSNTLRAYFTDGTSEYVDLESCPERLVNWNARDQLTGGHGQMTFAYKLYETGSDPRAFTTLTNAISVTYSGAGVASIVGTSGGNGTLDCKVDGVSVGGGFPISLGAAPGDTYYNVSDVTAKIAAIASGAWHATTEDDTVAAWTLAQRTHTYTPINGTATHLTWFIDYHTEWFHAPGAATTENVLFLDVTCRKSFFTTNPLNCEGTVRDAVARNSIWESAAQDSQNGSWAGSHVVMHNCYYDAPFPIYEGGAYCSIRQSYFASVGLGSGQASMPTVMAFADCVAGSAWPAGSPLSNTTLASYSAFQALVVDKAAGNFQPATGVRTAARLDPYDGRLNPRALVDALGPRAAGFTADAWPF